MAIHIMAEVRDSVALRNLCSVNKISRKPFITMQHLLLNDQYNIRFH